jgi:hypothetical protein
MAFCEAEQRFLLLFLEKEELHSTYLVLVWGSRVASSSFVGPVILRTTCPNLNEADLGVHGVANNHIALF